MKNNYLIIMCILFTFGITIYSFYDVIKSYYLPAYENYNMIKENCPGDSVWCSNFKSKESVEKYLLNNKPKDEFDAITLSIYVLRNDIMNIFLIISPLIIIIMVVASIQSQINSGYFKNMLTRLKYKSLLKKYILIAAKSALLLPCLYIFVHIISCFITGFNFEVKTFYIEQYGNFIYNHFFIYSLLFLIAQYIIYFGYGLIGIITSFKCYNKIISIVLGYIYFIVLQFVYMLISAIFFRDVLGMPSSYTEFFNLLGYYWFFDENTIYWIVYTIVLSVVIINMLVIKIYIGSKEKAINVYEKVAI